MQASSGSSLATVADFDACRAILARGSRSFHFASRALPARLRAPVSAFYAFCRESDDAIDESREPLRAIEVLRGRVERIFAEKPDAHAVDRAFAATVRDHSVPRAPIEALLDGYLWDVEGRRYRGVGDVLGYAARVASSVGVVMTWLMGRRDRAVLARACDLGAAMQLTNIARDVGEDARNGRIYLPLDWLEEEGVDALDFVQRPRPSAGLGRVTQRLLLEAETLYVRAEPGIAQLPGDCRAAIAIASRVYREIGRRVAENGYDAVSVRASTSTWRKLELAAGALTATPRTARYDDAPLSEVELLLPPA